MKQKKTLYEKAKSNFLLTNWRTNTLFSMQFQELDRECVHIQARAWIWSQRQNLLSVTIHCETIEWQLIIQMEPKATERKRERKKALVKEQAVRCPNMKCMREHVHNHHYPRNVSANFIIIHYRLHVKIAHGIIDDLHTKTQLPDRYSTYIHMLYSWITCNVISTSIFAYFAVSFTCNCDRFVETNNWIRGSEQQQGKKRTVNEMELTRKKSKLKQSPLQANEEQHVWRICFSHSLIFLFAVVMKLVSILVAIVMWSAIYCSIWVNGYESNKSSAFRYEFSAMSHLYFHKIIDCRMWFMVIDSQSGITSTQMRSFKLCKWINSTDWKRYSLFDVRPGFRV